MPLLDQRMDHDHEHLCAGRVGHPGWADRQERHPYCRVCKQVAGTGGISKLDAVRSAAMIRLRPVLMTSVATVAGHFSAGAGHRCRWWRQETPSAWYWLAVWPSELCSRCSWCLPVHVDGEGQVGGRDRRSGIVAAGACADANGNRRGSRLRRIDACGYGSTSANHVCGTAASTRDIDSSQVTPAATEAPPMGADRLQGRNIGKRSPLSVELPAACTCRTYKIDSAGYTTFRMGNPPAHTDRRVLLTFLVALGPVANALCDESSRDRQR